VGVVRWHGICPTEDHRAAQLANALSAAESELARERRARRALGAGGSPRGRGVADIQGARVRGLGRGHRRPRDASPNDGRKRFYPPFRSSGSRAGSYGPTSRVTRRKSFDRRVFDAVVLHTDHNKQQLAGPAGSEGPEPSAPEGDRHGQRLRNQPITQLEFIQRYQGDELPGGIANALRNPSRTGLPRSKRRSVRRRPTRTLGRDPIRLVDFHLSRSALARFSHQSVPPRPTDAVR